ncbi:MAG: GntR family transcriptional regulator [Betaproteobacteria bacterium]|nr:MAG: GntR family transcriptional regulator [Betaproteobacteria bacterium]
MTATDSRPPGAEPPLCAAPDPAPRKPKLKLPALACDCHAHICGPQSRYAYWSGRVYTPMDCLLPAYRQMLRTLGVQRAVLVQPSVYGCDNTAMLDAMREAGPDFRGVAVVDETVSDVELERMHAAGVRGLRCNIVDIVEDQGKLPLAMLERLAGKIKPFGWHIELLMHADEFPAMDRAFADFPVDIVLGHLGYQRAEKGIDDPGFQALLRLMRAGKAWVKLTGPYRISSQGVPYPDTVPFAQALLEAAPERVVWGSDWPHVMVKGPMPNDGDLCDLLAGWIPDATLRQRVLVDNPARLYGF